MHHGILILEKISWRTFEFSYFQFGMIQGTMVLANFQFISNFKNNLPACTSGLVPDAIRSCLSLFICCRQSCSLPRISMFPSDTLYALEDPDLMWVIACLQQLKQHALLQQNRQARTAPSLNWQNTPFSWNAKKTTPLGPPMPFICCTRFALSSESCIIAAAFFSLQCLFDLVFTCKLRLVCSFACGWLGYGAASQLHWSRELWEARIW